MSGVGEPAGATASTSLGESEFMSQASIRADQLVQADSTELMTEGGDLDVPAIRALLLQFAREGFRKGVPHGLEKRTPGSKLGSCPASNALPPELAGTIWATYDSWLTSEQSVPALVNLVAMEAFNIAAAKPVANAGSTEELPTLTAGKWYDEISMTHPLVARANQLVADLEADPDAPMPTGIEMAFYTMAADAHRFARVFYTKAQQQAQLEFDQRAELMAERADARDASVASTAIAATLHSLGLSEVTISLAELGDLWSIYSPVEPECSETHALYRLRRIGE